MNSYSQNGEDLIAYKYFGDIEGNILSLGENNGKTLSNSLGLIERGWNAVLVEPCEKSFKELRELHKEQDFVFCYQYAIADKEGDFDFYESDTHLNNGDYSLLSSLSPEEIIKWKPTTKFIKTKVKAITFNQLLDRSPLKTFDLISIDCEGFDWAILIQMNLTELGCKMLIIESNSIDDNKYIEYCGIFGMKLYHKNHENLIFVK